MTARAGLLITGVAVTLLFGGCRRPSAVNIDLRKRLQELEAQVTQMERQRQADRATISALQAQRETIATLPQERIDRLVTAHGLRLGRLTGGADLDPQQPGDDGLRIYAVPIDANGDVLKAAGSFVIQAFDLTRGEGHLVGQWEFDPQQALRHWFGTGLLYTYVLPCPFEQRPQTQELTVRVTYTDELTGRQFTEQRVVRLKLAETPQTPAPTAE
jgi:outer membrane murein-binding lipoprotein Lpp